ncbi:hypothetical protein AAC691_11750 [Nguyenibacter vanlangensis]|uniref:OmpA-like domain-containing protein n=1 Tax=Nguyenibacter vanlangensis TaxID=1216886 RepID=A0ABZ3D0E1_9PROT
MPHTVRRPFASALAAPCILAALTAGPVVPASVARAQVVTNDTALSTLGAAHGTTTHKAAAAAGHSGHAARPPARRAAPARTEPAGGKAASGSAAGHVPPAPTIPAAPPPPPIIRPPVVDVPLHPPPPPPPTPVVADAKGVATDLPGGLRLTFAAGSADMNAAMIDRVKQFAAGLLRTPDARAEVDATASGSPDDVSTPRRVSLERGLAIRSILVHAGVATTRIYVRAIGLPSPGVASGGVTSLGAANETVPDHVDVTRSDMVASTSKPPAPSEPHPAP